MTVKQGEDINQRFILLNDSIKILSNLVVQKKSEVSVLTGEKQKLDSTISLSLNNLIISEKEIKRLNDIIKKKDEFLQNERKNWAGWMFFSFMVTVLVGALK